MIIECITVVLCVLIVCISICYCNKPPKSVIDLERVLVKINQSLNEVKENTYYIDRKLEQFKAYLMDNQSKHNG